MFDVINAIANSNDIVEITEHFCNEWIAIGAFERLPYLHRVHLLIVRTLRHRCKRVHTPNPGIVHHARVQ